MSRRDHGGVRRAREAARASAWARSWASRSTSTSTPPPGPSARTWPTSASASTRRSPRSSASRSGSPTSGPASSTPTSAGATVIGAREFLIAYNVNLNTRDKKLRHATSRSTSASRAGAQARTQHGEFVARRGRQAVKKPGSAQGGARASAGTSTSTSVAQISMNLTNYKVTPLHVAFDECAQAAPRAGHARHRLRAGGPRPAPGDARRRPPLPRRSRAGPPGMPEEELIATSRSSRWGSTSSTPFDPRRRRSSSTGSDARRAPLMEMTVPRLRRRALHRLPRSRRRLRRRALRLAGRGLGAMVANLTAGNKDMFDRLEEMARLAVRGQEVKDRLSQPWTRTRTPSTGSSHAMRMPRKDRRGEAAKAAGHRSGQPERHQRAAPHGRGSASRRSSSPRRPPDRAIPPPSPTPASPRRWPAPVSRARSTTSGSTSSSVTSKAVLQGKP